MAGEWRYVQFRDICEHSAFGPRFSSDEYAPDGNVACLRTTDIDSNGRIDLASMPLAKLDLTRFRSHFLQRDDLVITRTGAYLGKAAVFTEFRLPVLAGAFSIRFQLNRNLADPLYCRYYFNSPDGQAAIRAIATGSVQPNLNIPNLHSLKLPLPSVTEQRVIVHILGTFDDKIDLNRRMNETLEAMARALFKSWFVDFDPVRAKRDGRKPAGMDKATAALFPDSFQDSPLGKIPTGWETGVLEDMLVLQRGFDLPADARTPGRFRVFAAGGPHGFHNEAMVDGPGVVTGRSGVLGNVFLVLEPFWPLNTVLWIKEFRRSRPVHAYHLLQTLDFSTFNAGSAVPTLNRNHVHNLPVALPPREVIDCYESIALPFYQYCRRNEIESESLAALRDALLPKLLSGEIPVSEGEQIVGREV